MNKKIHTLRFRHFLCAQKPFLFISNIGEWAKYLIWWQTLPRLTLPIIYVLGQSLFRPAKSGKWRKCYLRKFSNVNSTKQRIYMLFLQTSGFFFIKEILDFVETFHWKLEQNRGSFLLCRSFFPPPILQHKGDI